MKHPVLTLGLLGAIVGLLVGGLLPRTALSLKTGTRRLPLPHQVSKYPGGISLRFAMVHDVLHERFPRHGEAYYRHRNALVSAQLAKLGGMNAARGVADPHWKLADDLAVGHVHLGEYPQAIALMRRKLTAQQQQGIKGRDLYPTYANLGTAMMIEALVKLSAPSKPAPAIDADPKAELRESLIWVQRSIQVNPQAHFGREIWQVALGEHLLAGLADPHVLTTWDMVGDRLSLGVPSNRSAVRTRRREQVGERVALLLQNPGALEAQREELRRDITRVGVDENWRSKVKASVKERPAFDEPVLGIVGMWRYGGGANPHFALALARIMDQVGQPHLAWSGYERTARLLEGGGLDADVGKALIDYCRERQRRIEADLSRSKTARSTPQQLRAAFDADLKAGLDYQKAYQAHEAQRIAAGGSIDDPRFYDGFKSQHGEIASTPGDADFVTVQQDGGRFSRFAPPVVLGAGLFAFASAFSRSKRRTATKAG